jgi:hypothetical protein
MREPLETRVEQFRCLELPGQPMSMHMGTSYLVGDLWKEVQGLREVVAQRETENAKLKADNLDLRRDEALNEAEAENAKLREALQKIADHNFDALKGSTKDYYVALKEGMSIALAARAVLGEKL